MGYDVATFGNHEFDWGQVILANRTTEATYPFVTANIVKNDTGNCATAGWTKPDFADAPYEIKTVGTAPNTVKVAFIGVTTTGDADHHRRRRPPRACASRIPADSILHYYDAMKAAGADVIVVLSHLGYRRRRLRLRHPGLRRPDPGREAEHGRQAVNLIIGGHSHTNLAAATMVGTTTVVQAYYNGRKVGQADITVGTAGAVTVAWSRKTGTDITSGAEDPTIDALINDLRHRPGLPGPGQPAGRLQRRSTCRASAARSTT